MFSLGYGFGLFCAVIIIGWFIVQGGKSVGNAVSNLTSRYSGCSANMTDDAKYWDMSYIGPNNHIEMTRLVAGSACNNITSLTYDNRIFKAVVERRDLAPDRLLERKNCEAHTLKELAKIIEKQFKEWDVNSGHEYLWKYPCL